MKTSHPFHILTIYDLGKMSDEDKSCCMLGYDTLKLLPQTLEPLILLPHDVYMPKIYIIGGMIFIVTKYVHIYELY